MYACMYHLYLSVRPSNLPSLWIPPCPLTTMKTAFIYPLPLPSSPFWGYIFFFFLVNDNELEWMPIDVMANTTLVRFKSLQECKEYLHAREVRKFTSKTWYRGGAEKNKLFYNTIVVEFPVVQPSISPLFVVVISHMCCNDRAASEMK